MGVGCETSHAVEKTHWINFSQSLKHKVVMVQFFLWKDVIFMMPYYSFPFEYGDRNSMNMPQVPVAPQQVQPLMPDYMQQNMMPQMQTPVPNPMPLCPYMQQPMPIYPTNPMPVMPGTNVLPEMNNPYYGEEMDLSPATARPDDPPPILSNNPASTRIVLFKELTGYPNYGNPSGNADILYTGNCGTWTFDVPVFLAAFQNFRAQIVIRGVLDDHYDVPENRYSARITINGQTVHTGRVPLVHGRPAGSQFNNWRPLTFNIDLRRNNRIVIVNTSNAGPNDWIGLDWMELRLIPR